MQHIIKKQVIDLTLDKRLNHFHIQQRVSTHYWAYIVPLLQKAFDKIGDDEQVIELDKLEIDLGVFSEKSIEKNEWGIVLQSKIEELLITIVHPASPKTGIHNPKRLSAFHQWLFYMKKGYLPWNVIKADDHWYQLVLEALAVDFESVQLLRDLIKSDINIQKRIVSQHDEFYLLRLTEIFTAEKQNDLPEAIIELVILAQFIQKQQNVPKIESEKEINSKLWRKVLELAAPGNESRLKGKLVEQIVSSFVQENRLVNKLPFAISQKLRVTHSYIIKSSEEIKAKLVAEKKLIAKTLRQLKDTIENKSVIPAKDDIRNIKNEERVTAGVTKEGQEKLSRPEKEFSLWELNKKITDTIDEDGIFVVNAGVVILHPFLHSLFSRLNLTAEGIFTDKLVHQKALCLLHYLATGNTNAEEHELIIGKIMCAYPIEYPVDRGIEISKELLDEADDMIIAAILQWERLKGTTPAGLREGFLQRSGKLSSWHGNLYLQVEKNAIDILLDYLPWNLSMIKLPWMKDILRVEWR